LHFSRARGSIVQAGIFGTFVTTKVQADFNKLFALMQKVTNPPAGRAGRSRLNKNSLNTKEFLKYRWHSSLTFSHK
jgi:hypothetical protein